MATSYLTRRDFINFSAMAAAMLGFAGCQTLAKNPRKPRPIAPGAKVRVAQIGCGGKGFSDIMQHKDENVVAMCDVDWEGGKSANLKKLMAEFPNAKRYSDFRKMLLEMDDQIDAVIVSTPDHMHFLPAYMAIMLGKHVYIQKPLTQTVGEARELLRLARLNGVCTQMGNQGHAGEGIRLVREWFQAGVLGEVKEAQIWTNRPVWPQGFPEWPKAEPVPPTLSWDLFLGRAQQRPYSSAIHPFKWRGLIDYGCGALGDMACHLMDAAYWNLELGSPTTVELKEIEDASKVAFPKSAIVEYHFPARKSADGRSTLPPVKLTWHEGGKKPAKPAQMEADRQLAKGGQLIIGSKATVYDGNDYCNSPRIVPESLHQKLQASFPPKTLPRVPQNEPHREWITGIRANNPLHAGSNFEYSVPFTEMVCLGTMAILAGGKFSWDPVKMSSGRADVDKYLYPTYRKGWEMDAVVA
jgi:predicted dehydrogenase